MAKRKNKTFPEQITVYATAEEKRIIERRTRESGAASRSRYIAEAAAEGAIIEVAIEEGQTAEGLRAIQAEIEELSFQLRMAGQNLNEVLAKINVAREYEIIPAQALRHAADQVAHAAAAVEAEGGTVQQKIDRAEREAEQKKRNAVEQAKADQGQA